MTRETKIGLLVGLAFIIVIGILLSDHLSSTNSPVGAPLRAAGDSLRSGLGQPGGEDATPALRAPANVVPAQPVVTNEELTHHSDQPPIHFVNPPNGGGGAITPNPNLVANNNTENKTGNNPGKNNVANHLRDLARQHGEEIEPVIDGGGVNNAGREAANNNPPVDPPVVPTPDPTPDHKPTVKTYVAQSGDSLSTIALKAYGSSCKANREAIVAANPALAANRDLIVAGRAYTIPPLDKPAAPANTPKPAPTAHDTTYIVKAHDTLWSIAINEVGTPSAVAAIKELNQDVLNGSDRVRPNMKLILPAKKSDN